MLINYVQDLETGEEHKVEEEAFCSNELDIRQIQYKDLSSLARNVLHFCWLFTKRVGRQLNTAKRGPRYGYRYSC
jgi:hypothetical protein